MDSIATKMQMLDGKSSDRRIRSGSIAILLCVLFFGAASSLPISQGQASAPSAYYIPSTGHQLAEPFLSYWLDENGERALGMPVTDEVRRGSRQAQYFEYGALVEKRNGSVSRIKAGRDLQDQLRIADATVSGRRVTGDRYARSSGSVSADAVDDSAGIRVDDQFHETYEQFGGDEAFGIPISVAYRDGARLSQWFEYGRLDMIDGAPAVASIGLELAIRSGADTRPSDQGDVPIFDPARFTTFYGDGVVPEAAGAFSPARLTIPRIRVNASIEETGVDNGVMTNPLNPWNAGWYSSFSRPGEWTNVVIAGHRDWWNQGPVVFWNLGYLLPGDKVYLVGADGTGATYVVSGTEVVPENVDPQTIISDIGYEALTLITCGGTWDGTEYSDRIVVRAYRI